MKLIAFKEKEANKKVILISTGIVLIISLVLVVFSYSLYQSVDEGTVADGIIGEFCVECIVNFDANGGNVEQTSKEVTYGENYGELPIPKKIGYRFLGWYTDTNYETEITSTSNVELRSEQTLYAKWEERERSVLIKAANLNNYTGKSEFFWSTTYKSKIKNITIEDEINIRDNKIEQWDISEAEDESIIAYVVPNETEGYYDLYIQSNNYIEANSNMSYWFAYFRYLDSLNGLDLINTSKVTDMSQMFNLTGDYSTIFALDLGDNFDTSKVTDMSRMFYNLGKRSTNFTLDLGDKFDTSNVTNMSHMFYNLGERSTNFTLDLGEKFDTSKVTNMYSMFEYTGYKSPNFTLDLGDKFDTSKVTNMRSMFGSTGRNSTVFTLDLGDKFDTSKVTNMRSMFGSTGESSTVFTLNLGDKFDTTNVTDMWSMFKFAGESNVNFTLDLGDKFDTSKVTNIGSMFYRTGYNSTKLNTIITIRCVLEYTGDYSEIFTDVATKPGSQMTVNYTKETSEFVDNLIEWYAKNSNVVKGVQVD